jgi:plastocyanin domain-containing protein
MRIKLFVLLGAIGILSLSTLHAVAQSKTQTRKPRVQTARILIDRMGYSRTSINLRRGIPARLTFVRQTNETCATEIVIPEYGINRNLPLNEPTVVNFVPRRSGTFSFTCGMNMMRGKLMVR